MRTFLFLNLLFISFISRAGASSFAEMCLWEPGPTIVDDSLKDPGVVCYDSLIIVHGIEGQVGKQNLVVKVYSNSLELLHQVVVNRPGGSRCVSIIPVQNYWWILYASSPVLTSESAYVGSTGGFGGQQTMNYFTSVYKPLPGEIIGVLVLDSAFNSVSNTVVADRTTLNIFKQALQVRGDLGVNNYPVFTGRELAWCVAKEIHCATVDDPKSGILVKRWQYNLVGPTINTVNLLGIVHGTVVVTYSQINPVQVKWLGIQVDNSKIQFDRALTDSTGTIFPSRIVETSNGFLLAGGYVAKLTGPYPYTYTETYSERTRYYGRIDGTFIAEFDTSWVQKKVARTLLPAGIREKPEDKFSLKACRFAICPELRLTSDGVVAVFEIAYTKKPFEAKEFNRRAPDRMEQFYIPHSYVAGIVSMRTDQDLATVVTASCIWNQRIEFKLNRNSYDYFSTVYPGPQSSCFRSVRSNPHKAYEYSRETNEGFYFPKDDDKEYYSLLARQAFPGSDNNPFDIQSFYSSNSEVHFDFTIQDTLNQGQNFTPLYSYHFIGDSQKGAILPNDSKKVIYRVDEYHAVTVSFNNHEQGYVLKTERL